VIGFGDSPDGSTPRCSRAGCGSAATAAVNWRNPKIHSADRVKTWLACDEHREYLRDYLATRDFPVVVTALDDIPAIVPAIAPAITPGGAS
jgi:hypothetical protein